MSRHCEESIETQKDRPDVATALSALCEVLYGAALEPARWPEALRCLGRFLTGDDDGLVVVTFAEGLREHEGWAMAGLRGALERHYDTEVIGNPLFSPVETEAPGAHPRAAVASVAALSQLSLAREFVLRCEEVHGITDVLHRRDDLVAVAHVLQPASAPVDRAAQRLAEVRVHLARAVEVYVRLRSAKRHIRIDQAQLDAVDIASLVANAAGRVLRTNRAADSLLARRDGVWTDEGRLRCDYPSTEEALARALRHADDLSGAARLCAVLIPRRSGRRPFLAFVCRVELESAAAGYATVLIRDADAEHVETDGLLAQLFGLTPSEVRVALGIARGDSPQSLARHLGLSVETVRSHLKRVFFKTATRNQADLVRLVVGECAVGS